MSNKTQLQTNNTVLDALITRVSVAKDTVASLPEAGGGSSYEIETFTVDCDNIYLQGTPTPNPFIVGMTWAEFVNSPLNFMRYNGYFPTNYQLVGESVKINNLAGVAASVSIDGTQAGEIRASDKILSTNYLTYTTNPEPD